MKVTKKNKSQLKRASNAALASLLNLTILPIISFLVLVFLYRKTVPGTIDHYHARLGIKINIFAAAALILVSALMILLGGFNSAWTWVYVISYFTIVHTAFIVVALWALVRAWSGERLKDNVNN
ncbi:MAG: hypothetical protein COA54_10630 [Thiotrichaceae bacterium]|nr:MAG: hypothetical protein COA54_10630 [Thiotrichaceae bacterium]